MRTLKTLFVLNSTVFFCLLFSPRAWAVRPLSASLALVAGDEGTAGYRDGSFTSALFNKPMGLAVSRDGNSLFVADSGNNRIRVIHLDQDNQVTTLAGQGTAGKLDGPLAEAEFNDPRGVLFLPGDRLVVNDFGNQQLRIVDLRAGTVATLAGGAANPGPSPSVTPLAMVPAEQASMKDVRAMAYVGSTDSIFYTQLDSDSLKKLDLKTNLVSTVFGKNSQLPHPAALWYGENNLYVADQDLPLVCQVGGKNMTDLKPVPLAAPQTQMFSLCANGGILYGLLNKTGVPAQRFPLNGLFDNVAYKPQNGIQSYYCPWGDVLPMEDIFSIAPGSYFKWIGFVPDPSDSRKFFLSKPEHNMIVTFRDIFFTGFNNSNGVIEPEYPAKKSKNAYRIMICGDSRSFEIHDFPFKTDFRPLVRQPSATHVIRLAPRVAEELNFQAALNDISSNYEVFNQGLHGELLVWPTFLIPEVAKRNDIDLVIIFSPQGDLNPYDYYFDHPLTADGIPQCPNDLEYLLKPPLERIPDGLPRKFYDYCRAHGLVNVNGKKLDFDPRVYTDPALHDWIVDFYGKSYGVLERKLSALKTSGGKSPRLMILLTYTERGWIQHHDTELWIEAAKKYNFEYLDLNPDMTALHLSYFPLTEEGSHFIREGADFFGKLLANVLVRNKLIPWDKETKPTQEKPAP